MEGEGGSGEQNYDEYCDLGHIFNIYCENDDRYLSLMT